jgi:hypothetical protein
MLEAGALDAIVISAQMKKGRPGVLVQVIAAPEKREELIAILFRETTTLGFVSIPPNAACRRASGSKSRTPHGIVRVKIRGKWLRARIRRRAQNRRRIRLPLKQILAEAASIRILKTRNEILPHDADLLRQRRAAHRPHLHDAGRRHHQAPQAHAGLRRRLTTGTDEHGQKVERSARPWASRPKNSRPSSRTNSARSGTARHPVRPFHPHHRPAHYETVRWLFERCLANGYVYKGSYTGQYCVFDELYVNDAKPGDPAPTAAVPPKRSPKRTTSSSSRPSPIGC